MVMKSLEWWRYPNRARHGEVVVRSASEVAGGNSRCVPGFPMRKSHRRPRLRHFDFLAIEDSAVPRGASHSRRFFTITWSSLGTASATAPARVSSAGAPENNAPRVP